MTWVILLFSAWLLAVGFIWTLLVTAKRADAALQARERAPREAEEPAERPRAGLRL